MVRIQDRPDARGIPIDWVGITNLVYPAEIEGPDGSPVEVPATFDLLVNLAPDARGTHMSRFVEALEAHRSPVTPKGLRALLETLRDRLGSDAARARTEYTAFVPREGPVSKGRSVLACDVVLEATLRESFDLVLAVTVPVMTLCPCSIETPGGAGHSQRGVASVAVRFDGVVAVREIVDLVDDCGSAPVYPLLKRDDEREVLDHARRHPVLIEDLVRNIAERLDSDVRIHWYRVEAENNESTHDHDAYAAIERER